MFNIYNIRYSILEKTNLQLQENKDIFHAETEILHNDISPVVFKIKARVRIIGF
jgi:hypothetical protein